MQAGQSEFLKTKDMWLRKDANLSDKLQTNHSNTGRVSIQKKEENDFSVITRASGGLALRGVLISENSVDVIALRHHLIKVPDDIKLDGAFKPQFEEVKHFGSRSKEEQYCKEVEILGYSVSAAAKEGSCGVNLEVDFSKSREEEKAECSYQENMYTSTIKYCFMPLASCTLKQHKLQLSEDSLAHLHKIDKRLSKLSVVHEECINFFQTFGSHVFIGPLHFGGRYMWKIYTSGFKEIEREETQALQSEAIGALMNTSYGNIAGISGAINTSSMFGSLKRDYSKTLTSQTFIQVEITGGPPNATGLLDWKKGLEKNSRTWHLIDRGLLHVPNWDVIENNYAHEFIDVTVLVATLKRKWQMSCLKAQQVSCSQ